MIKKRSIGINVVEAARERIIKDFSKGRMVTLSFSGGKDSIVLAHLVYDLILKRKINKDLLTVRFIDEEAMFDDVINIVKLWRDRFMNEGVKFEWYCLQVKHFNCLNSMTEEETFVCWDQRKKDVWVRPMPKFAIKDDPFLIPYKDNYQAFLERKDNAYKCISMRGVRIAESVQRYRYIASKKRDDISLPIYDMTDKDVWLYIRKFGLEYPEVYENLYRTGSSKKNLRISQFFSIDTARVLVNLGEMYPDLMERVTRREPNAYLCALYWDTEMFGRNTKKRRELEENQTEDEKKDYKKLVLDFFEHPEEYPSPELAHHFKRVILGCNVTLLEKDWKAIYECVMRGDPKQRTRRAIEFSLQTKRLKGNE